MSVFNKFLKRVLIFMTVKFFKFFVKNLKKDKIIMPRNLPEEVYEIFPNINAFKFFENKIILPYIDLDFLKNLNIYKPYEIIEIHKLSSNSSIELKIKKFKEIVLPIAILDKKNFDGQINNEMIKISYGNENVELELKYKNRFHYLPIRNNNLLDSIKVSSGKSNLTIGKPIYKNISRINGKPKLIVQIFIDALAQTVIDEFGYKVMPNTKKFFENGGSFYQNTYAQSEWTLSSIAGIFTGKYTNEHLVFHPRKADKIKDITIADVLQNNGYLTFGCSNIPKLTPINGFDKGFDRYIQAINKDYNYVINEAFEQLDAFGGNQYLFLGFFDTHESHRLQPISSQVLNKLKDFRYRKLKGNSKDTSILYDRERINMYKNSLTHLDKKLNSLYNKISEYDSEAIVILHSDHGINFMTQTKELLSKEREKVIFLYRNNKKLIYSNDIKEIRELPSMICKDLKIKDYFNYKKNGFSITESIYPKKEYEIAVRSNKYVLFFKVNWFDINSRNFSNYKPKISIHNLNDEKNSINIKSCKKEYDKMISLAKEHYKKICQNLIKQKK